MFTDKAAAKIGRTVLACQKFFGDSLNKLTKNFRSVTWKILIAITATIWTLISAHTIAMSFKKIPIIGKPSSAVIITSIHRDSLVLLEHIYEQRKKKQK